MLRKLPPTITADQTPEWLPIGWIAHSTVLKRGRQTRTYTELRTGKKFSTKDQVLEYIKMINFREEREFGVHRKKLKAFQDISETARERDSQIKPRIGSFVDNPETMDMNNTSNDFKTCSKEEVLLHQNVVECGTSSDEEGCNQISYLIEEDEEDLLENEYVEDITISSLRSQPVRAQKLESRAKTQCVFEDEDMSSDSDSDNKLPEANTSKGENASGEPHVLSNLVESFDEVECEDKTKETRGLTGSFTIEIDLDCEPASDRLIGTRNIEIRDQESDLMHMSVSSKGVEAIQESIDPSVKAQAEEVTDIDDLSKNIKLGLDSQKKSISDSKTYSSKNINKTEASTKRLKKGKTRRRIGSLDIEPCPYFPFEPIESSFGIEDDSAIRSYLEEYYASARNQGIDKSSLPLPDFGLSSFSDIKISPNEETESKKKKSTDPSGVQVASSSQSNCNSMGTNIEQIVAGN